MISDTYLYRATGKVSIQNKLEKLNDITEVTEVGTFEPLQDNIPKPKHTQVKQVEPISQPQPVVKQEETKANNDFMDGLESSLDDGYVVIHFM